MNKFECIDENNFILNDTPYNLLSLKRQVDLYCSGANVHSLHTIYLTIDNCITLLSGKFSKDKELVNILERSLQKLNNFNIN